MNDDEAAGLLLKAIMLRLGTDKIMIPRHEAQYIASRAQTFRLDVSEDTEGLHIHLVKR